MSTFELLALVPALNAEGFLTRLIPASEEVPLEQLVVVLYDNNPELIWQLEIMFLPLIEEPSVLQFFVPLPFEINQISISDLARFILLLNTKLSLTGFELREENGWVYYRHLMTCSESELDEELIVNTVWMISYVLDRFAPILREVVEGHKNLQQGIETLAHNLEVSLLT